MFFLSKIDGKATCSYVLKKYPPQLKNYKKYKNIQIILDFGI